MWNRRDFAMLAAAAVATFGLTVATFWPRVATAVDEKPAATVEVKVPTLALGSVQVTAQLDKEKTHGVVLTVTNTSYAPAVATFGAAAMVASPTSPMSRVIQPAKQVWNQEYAINLKPNETQTIKVALPETAFEVAPAPAQPNDKTPAAFRTIPGRSYLLLSSNQQRQPINALPLAPAVAIAPAVEPRPVPTAPPKVQVAVEMKLSVP